jgi:hypothetical protein
MNSDFQTIAALVIVAIAAIWLVVRTVRRRNRHSCGSDCGYCPTDKLKR